MKRYDRLGPPVHTDMLRVWKLNPSERAKRDLYIRERYRDGFGMREIARKVRLSPRSVQRIARSEVDQRLYSRHSGLLVQKPMRDDQHGKPSGARAHERRGETPCPACREATRINDKERREAKRNAHRTQ